MSFDTVQDSLFGAPVVSKKRLMEREAALEAHGIFSRLMYGAYDEMIAAGSVRRGKEFVNDLEEVCRPRFEGEVNLLEKRLIELIEAGEIIRPDLIEIVRGDGSTDTRASMWGDAWKRLELVNPRVPIDLFIVTDPDTWGRQLVTRTGPGDFSKELVTARPYGLKPIGLECRDGGVYTQGGELIPTPTERDYFEVLEVPFIEPEDRDRWREILRRAA